MADPGAPNMNMSVNTKKRKRAIMLPNTMILDAAQGSWRFVDNPKHKDNLEWLKECVGTQGSIESMPILTDLKKAGYALFADEDGMQKMLPMNLVCNPFIPVKTLCMLASMGGPYGNLVLYREKGNCIHLKDLTTLCKETDESQETDDAFINLLNDAVDAFRAKHDNDIVDDV